MIERSTSHLHHMHLSNIVFRQGPSHYVLTFCSGPALKKYGHLRVQALLARETFPAHFQGTPLVAQFSSLGSLDERWLSNEFRVSLSAGLSSSGGESLSLFVCTA